LTNLSVVNTKWIKVHGWNVVIIFLKNKEIINANNKGKNRIKGKKLWTINSNATWNNILKIL
jgi:hypothetical protein